MGDKSVIDAILKKQKTMFGPALTTVEKYQLREYNYTQQNRHAIHATHNSIPEYELRIIPSLETALKDKEKEFENSYTETAEKLLKEQDHLSLKKALKSVT